MDKEQALVNLIGLLLHKAGSRIYDVSVRELEAFACERDVKVQRRGDRVVVTVDGRAIKLASSLDLLGLNRRN